MFGIQELDDMVYGLLSRQDLVQCARVNKEWHTVVIPHLWKDLSYLNASSIAQRQSFTVLLLEDYLHDQQKAGSQKDETGTEQLVQAQPPSPSALAKYGCWIQTLPAPKRLVRLSDDSIQLAWKQTGQDMESVKQGLLLHLFKRYHTAQLPRYSLDYNFLESRNLNEETIAQLVLPRVRHLTVRASYRGERCELWKLKRLLGLCSTALEKLTIKFDYDYSDLWSSNFEEEEEDKAGSTEWSSLRELTLRLRNYAGHLQPTLFWSWFFKRCSQVERINISDFHRRPAEDITENMSEHMPKLNEITIGGGTHDYSTIYPVENLLSGSRNGWKVIVFTKPARSLSSSMNAIRKHFQTLQELRMIRADFRDIQFIEMLSSCPNLHTFYGIGVRGIRLSCNMFIDQDSHTGELKAWLCESYLKVLKVDIGYIPRPELKGVGVIREAHPGQGREIQGLVYDRLARLRNLETLSLGDTPEEDINNHLQRRTVENQVDWKCH